MCFHLEFDRIPKHWNTFPRQQFYGVTKLVYRNSKTLGVTCLPAVWDEESVEPLTCVLTNVVLDPSKKHSRALNDYKGQRFRQ